MLYHKQSEYVSAYTDNALLQKAFHQNPGSAGLLFYLATVELFAAAPADQITRVRGAATSWFENGPAFRASAFRSRSGGLFFIVHRLFPFL